MARLGFPINANDYTAIKIFVNVGGNYSNSPAR